MWAGQGAYRSTYFVAFMPLALLLALGVFCARRKEVPTPSEAAFGVAATLVAILVLRNVPIPPAITGLTRLDILFGLQAAVLVALIGGSRSLPGLCGVMREEGLRGGGG